jgi:hypothetical protein
MHSVRPRRSREHRRGKGRQRGTGRARTHQQGSHDSPERDPSCCPYDRPLRRPCPVAQRPAPPGTIIPKSVTNGHGGSRIQGLAAAARLGRPARRCARCGRAGRKGEKRKGAREYSTRELCLGVRSRHLQAPVRKAPYLVLGSRFARHDNLCGARTLSHPPPQAKRGGVGPSKKRP